VFPPGGLALPLILIAVSGILFVGVGWPCATTVEAETS
jgi:hypothetical protein